MSTAGPNSPGTMENNAAVGIVAWSNPDYAKSSNNVRTSATNWSGDGTTNYLKATNFGFTIPADVTIDGITVEIELTGDSGTTESAIKIVKADGSVGSTNKSTGANLPSVGSETYVTYGGSADKWGESWTKDDINDTDFGVVFSAYVPFFCESNVDHIRITITYTEVVRVPRGPAMYYQDPAVC